MSNEALRQAQAEQLTLLIAENKAGYYGVVLEPRSKSKPFKAELRRGGKTVRLGTFATAEEAALCVARTPEGQAAVEKAAAAPPLTSEEARQQAQAERLTLRVADNTTGYFGVYHQPGRTKPYPKPYQARVTRDGRVVSLGTFATVEEAALCVARSPEGRAAAQKPTARAVLPLRSKEARQQVQAAAKLALRVADNKTGYFGVRLDKRSGRSGGKSKPYQAQVKRGGKQVTLGQFVTAKEAALCVAQTAEGQHKIAEVLTPRSKEALQQAQAEGLTLCLADSTTGYFGVSTNKSKNKPFQAKVWRDGKYVHLGLFVTAEEAALCIARSPEGKAAAERPAGTVPLTSKEARQQAQAEGLTLRLAESKAGFFGVHLSHPGNPRPFQAKFWRDGKEVYLGYFVTAEEAALYIARSPAGQAAAAEKAVAPAPLTSEEALQQVQAEGLTLRVAKSDSGFLGVHRHRGRKLSCKTKPYEARVRRGGKEVYLGAFATAEEAALSVARSSEGRAAAKRAAARRAAAPPLASKEAQQQARDAIIGAVALDIIYEAAGAATEALSAEVAAEAMAGIAMGL